jgi:hypothetical protein
MSLPVLQIRGRIEGLGTVRVWYIRNWGPLHTATIGSGPTTTSISFGALTAGVYKNRTDIYKGMELEITTDPAPANVGQIARCSAFSNGVFTITPALPNTPTNASTTYALLIPIPTDGIAYFTEKVCSDMLRRSGNMEEWQMLQPELARLEENFTDHLTRRASGEPKRLFSSRLKRF